MGSSYPGPIGVPSRRRSQRLLLQVPVRIQGVLSSRQSFQEDTETRVVNAHGALVPLKAKVVQGQKLLIKHKKTQEEQECAVVYLGAFRDGRTEVAIEFTKANPRFWRVAFPPEDWTTRHPDAKTPGQT